MFLTMFICVLSPNLPFIVGAMFTASFSLSWGWGQQGSTGMPGIETCKIPQARKIWLGWRGLVAPCSFDKVCYNLWLSLSSCSQRFVSSNLRELFEFIPSATGSENPPQTWGGHRSSQGWEDRLPLLAWRLPPRGRGDYNTLILTESQIRRVLIAGTNSLLRALQREWILLKKELEVRETM